MKKLNFTNFIIFFSSDDVDIQEEVAYGINAISSSARYKKLWNVTLLNFKKRIKTSELVQFFNKWDIVRNLIERLIINKIIIIKAIS